MGFAARDKDKVVVEFADLFGQLFKLDWCVEDVPIQAFECCDLSADLSDRKGPPPTHPPPWGQPGLLCNLFVNLIDGSLISSGLWAGHCTVPELCSTSGMNARDCGCEN